MTIKHRICNTSYIYDATLDIEIFRKRTGYSAKTRYYQTLAAWYVLQNHGLKHTETIYPDKDKLKISLLTDKGSASIEMLFTGLMFKYNPDRIFHLTYKHRRLVHRRQTISYFNSARNQYLRKIIWHKNKGICNRILSKKLKLDRKKCFIYRLLESGLPEKQTIKYWNNFIKFNKTVLFWSH